jgi:DNA polymerase I-like protein with 3'-5' exonuclease and polymerase domains
MDDVEVFFVETWTGFLELVEHVKDNKFEYVSLDLETNTGNEKKAKIFGVGLCFTRTQAFYIPVRTPADALVWTTDELHQIYRWIRETCQKHKLIGWNLIYDVLVFENNSGFDISECIYCDGILLKHTLDEEPPHNLKDTGVKYLGPGADKAKERLYENIKANGGRTTNDHMEMWKADTDVLGEYCGWDTLLAYRLCEYFWPKLKEEGLEKLFYDEEIMPLYKEVTIDMKRHGFTVDVPYFEQLYADINKDILNLEEQIQKEIAEDVSEFVDQVLATDYAVKRSGNFPKVVAEIHGIKLPEKDGRVSLAKTALKSVRASLPFWFSSWLLDEFELDAPLARAAQLAHHNKATGHKYVFNLGSNNHLGWLMFEKWGLTPLEHTEGGKPKCDESFLDSVAHEHKAIQLLIDYKKLNKLASTYIDGILRRQIDGTIYTSMLQFGTTSGRYSSRDPNLQNLPRIKEDDADFSPIVLRYTNAIKRGFVAPVGYKLLNADYASLEPVCFAHVSNEERLRDVFRKGYDLYSTIAIDVFGLHEYSADKKAPNYLGKKMKEKRQLAKMFCLAVVYGAEAGRISKLMGIEYYEAQEIIDMYFDAYPNLKRYMASCDVLATSRGIARTAFGRIRHIPIARELASRWGMKLLDRRFAKQNDLGEIRYKLKNALNNAKNFPIQGLAAHIVNRAMIAVSRAFKAAGIVGRVIMQVHDEITCLVKEEFLEPAKKILQQCMEEVIKLSVPLRAEPVIASNWAEAK